MCNSLFNHTNRAEDITRIVEAVIIEAKNKSKDMTDADIDRGVRVMELYYLERLTRAIERKDRDYR